MPRTHLPTLVLALCIAALAAWNIALEVQVRRVQHEAATVEEAASEPLPPTVERPEVVIDVEAEPSV